MNDQIERPGPARKLAPKTIVWAVVALLTFVFVVQNSERTTINILFWDVTTGVWLALALATVLGAIIGYLAARHRPES